MIGFNEYGTEKIATFQNHPQLHFISGATHIHQIYHIPLEIACRELLRAYNPKLNRVVGGTTKSADVLHEEESCYQIIISQYRVQYTAYFAAVFIFF